MAFDAGLTDTASGIAGARGRWRRHRAAARCRCGDGRARAGSWCATRQAGTWQATPGFPVLRPGAPAYDADVAGEPVRVVALAVATPAGMRHVGVARTLRQRLDVRAAIVRSLVVLVSLGTITLVGVVWFSVGNGLRPLARMRADLASARTGRPGAHSHDGVPYEIAPVVSGFNDLLDKVEAGARAQRDFLADMAHQLRTPLAGVQLQLEWLARAPCGRPRYARIRSA